MTLRGEHHSTETRKKISETKRRESGRSAEPLQPQLCACGCGKYAAVDERRNRVSKYVAGHNSKSNHPMQGRHHSEETRAVLASYTGERGSAYRHGWARTPTYTSWNSMISRCRDQSNGSYESYGGRGIVVCERWLDFLSFLEDMGERPSLDHTLDRKDPDGDYEPGNVRWLTKAEQNARRRDPGGWAKKRAAQGK